MFDEEKTIMVSGGFDPVHRGHLRMIASAATYGKVIVVLNSDDWLMRKKGYCFMDFDHREEIMRSIKFVYRVTSVDDSDNSVCEAIRRWKPDYFANGGDRTKKNTPEQDVCEELGIEMLWGVGGEDKAAASSVLVERARQAKSA